MKRLLCVLACLCALVACGTDKQDTAGRSGVQRILTVDPRALDSTFFGCRTRLKAQAAVLSAHFLGAAPGAFIETFDEGVPLDLEKIEVSLYGEHGPPLIVTADVANGRAAAVRVARGSRSLPISAVALRREAVVEVRLPADFAKWSAALNVRRISSAMVVGGRSHQCPSP